MTGRFSSQDLKAAGAWTWKTSVHSGRQSDVMAVMTTLVMRLAHPYVETHHSSQGPGSASLRGRPGVFGAYQVRVSQGGPQRPLRVEVHRQRLQEGLQGQAGHPRRRLQVDVYLECSKRTFMRMRTPRDMTWQDVKLWYYVQPHCHVTPWLDTIMSHDL